MAFTVNELNLVNQALTRIGSSGVKDSENGSTTCNNYLKSYLVYSQTRDSLLRSFEWNFAITQVVLGRVSVITLSTEPTPDIWSVGDIITGLNSGDTAEVLSVIDGVDYEIVYLSDEFLDIGRKHHHKHRFPHKVYCEGKPFSDGDKITNAIVEKVYWEGQPIDRILWYDQTTFNEVQCTIGYPIVKTSHPTFHYKYQFLLPSDFLRLTHLWKSYFGALLTTDIPWSIQGNRFLSYREVAKIEYVKRVTDPADFDSMFTEVLILRLAMTLLPSLAGQQTSTFKESLRADLKEAVSRARTVCRAENNNTGRSEWNLARYGSGKVFPIDATKLY